MNDGKRCRRFAVIMAGGRGERLWPLSTAERPKQFLRLGGKQSMLQATAARVRPLIPEEDVCVVVPDAFTHFVREQLAISPERVIVEPMGRNTAPCIGLAAIKLEAEDPEGTMIVLPADHVIQDQARFLKILESAIAVAETEERLVTLGVIPDRPATGYGYIQQGKRLCASGDAEIYEVEKFTEKPDETTAVRFLQEGGYYWNSGMFVWRAAVILAAIEQHMPALYAGLQEIREHLQLPDFGEVTERVFRELKAVSIDYGVMERSDNVCVIPADIGWSDVGDWAALAEVMGQDDCGNVVFAEHVGIDTQNSMIYSTSSKPIATIGLDGVVIVDTNDGLLVIDKSRAQEVREIRKMVKGDGQ